LQAARTESRARLDAKALIIRISAATIDFRHRIYCRRATLVRVADDSGYLQND
jgi:hypothetical protein